MTTASVMSGENNRVSLYLVELPSHPPDFINALEKLLEDISVIDKTLLQSPELNGGDFEDFSKQEDKLKLIQVQL